MWKKTYIDQITFGQELRVRLLPEDAMEGAVFFEGVEGHFATQRDRQPTKRDIKTFGS